MYDYPNGRVDTLEVKSYRTDGCVPYPITTRWIPDAFVGPMRGLLQAIANDTQAFSSANDNLGTVRLVNALYQSMDTGQSVDMGV